jgi:hypothetical protein
MIGSPTNFRHTAHVGSGDMTTHVSAIKTITYLTLNYTLLQVPGMSWELFFTFYFLLFPFNNIFFYLITIKNMPFLLKPLTQQLFIANLAFNIILY